MSSPLSPSSPSAAPAAPFRLPPLRLSLFTRPPLRHSPPPSHLFPSLRSLLHTRTRALLLHLARTPSPELNRDSRE
jgi:hypothetical protein